MSLYQHQPHPHKPRNVNLIHKEERQSVNDKIALVLTKSVGSMWAAYSFVVIAVVGLLAILGIFTPLVALLVAWASQTLIQLVLLPVIMVAQNVLNRKQELQADEQYERTKKIYADIVQIMEHLNAQDAELLRQSEIIAKLLERKQRRSKAIGTN